MIFILRVLSKIKIPIEFAIYGPKSDLNYWKKCLNLINKLPSNVQTIINEEVPNNQVHNIFKNYDKIKNQLEFKFKNNSDTLIGHIHSQHTMDIKNNEDKLRLREISISVDNYTKTNNPFTKGMR